MKLHGLFHGTPVYTVALTYDGFERPVTVNGCLLPHIGVGSLPVPDNDNNDDSDDLFKGKYMWRVDVKAFHSIELMADTEEEARIKADDFVEAIGGAVDGYSVVEPME